MNKKGDLTGVIYLIAMIGVFAIFLLIVGYTVPLINNEIAGKIGINDGINHSLHVSNAIVVNTLPTIWLIMFAGLMLGLFATSYFVPTHPIFVPIFVLLLIVAIMVAIPISNAYEELAANADLATAGVQQTLIAFLMSKLPYIALITGLISLVISFAKPGGGDISLA